MRRLESLHPPILTYLFLTEMWERLGFYIVQGLLVLYLSQFQHLSDDTSFALAGSFTALAFISAIVGGFIANKILGFQTAVIWGGLFLIAGYALLALPFDMGFYPALATIIVGNGLFKPNIASLLGLQYSSNDPRREAGFTLFYVGVNVGALFAGLTSGYIQHHFGWQITFAFSAISLLICLFTFLLGLSYLTNLSRYPTHITPFSPLALVYALIGIVGVTLLLKLQTLFPALLPCIGIVLFFILLFLTLQQEAYRKPLLGLNSLILTSIVFWALYLQIFYATNLFIDRLVVKNFLGFTLSTTVFYAIASFYILLLGPLLAWIWKTLSAHHLNPLPVTKFILGIFLAGISFALLSMSTLFANEVNLIHPLWIFAAYFFLVLGELFISPIGLSAIAALAPPHLMGIMMGAWFVATGFGGIFAGLLAKAASIPQDTPLTQQLLIYQQAFLHYAYFAFFVAIILFFVRINWVRLMK